MFKISIIGFKGSILLCLIIICTSTLSFQHFKRTYNVSTEIKTNQFELFEFSINDSIPIKTAFFGKNAYAQFLKLQQKKDILFASSAAFTSSLKLGLQKPVGFCSENGNILNKAPNQAMDALVLINNKNANLNSVEVIDLDEETSQCKDKVCATHFAHSNIRNTPSDAYWFFKSVEENKLSGFQTQLVFTKNKTDEANFKQLKNGNNDRARRFLAICIKNDKDYHVIIDSHKLDYLMTSAKQALDYLRTLNYEVTYMVNLDTGSKDIMHAYNGETLVNLRPNPATSAAKIENASSLLVYYK